MTNPQRYPATPSGLSAAALAIEPGAIWSRIESYICHRFSERAVVWTIEGPGDWEPPLTPATVMLYTGAARVDAVALGPMNMKRDPINGDRLEYRRKKTVQSNGVMVSIPIHPDLAEVLAKLPNDRPFLATAYGKGRSPDGLGNAMRDWCDKAGLPECSAHGLRKACARRLAEAGATAHEIMAVTGHKTLAEVERYTATALREGMADSAFAKLLSRPNREQTVVNLPFRFATISPKLLKVKEK